MTEVIDRGVVYPGGSSGTRQSCCFPGVCVLPGGRWVVSFRAASTKEGMHDQHLLITWSDDEGQNWSEPIEPFSPMQIGQYSLGLPQPDLLANGRILVVYYAGFRGFYRAILTTGDTMCSEMVFLKCRFANCLTGLHLKNVQSLNFNFFGCDFESSAGDPFYTPYKASDTAFIRAEAGGCVNVYGGSILLHGTTLLLDPNFEVSEDPINMITGMYNFYGVAWEQWSAGRPLLFEKNGTGSMRARVNFDNCRVHQLMAAREANADLGALHNGMNVSIRNSNFTYGRIRLNIDENTVDQWGSLTIDNSQFVDYYERRSEAVKSLPNVNHHVRYINSAIRPIDHAVFDGKSKIDQMDFDILPDATVSAKAKRMAWFKPG